MSKKELTQDEKTTLSIYWQLLRSFEEDKGNQVCGMDAALIVGAYKHYNKITGLNIKPSYIKETP